MKHAQLGVVLRNQYSIMLNSAVDPDSNPIMDSRPTKAAFYKTATIIPEVPAHPGCNSRGEILDETCITPREAIEFRLIALKEDQLAAPIEESFFIGTVRVEVADLRSRG